MTQRWDRERKDCDAAIGRLVAECGGPEGYRQAVDALPKKREIGEMFLDLLYTQEDVYRGRYDLDDDMQEELPNLGHGPTDLEELDESTIAPVVGRRYCVGCGIQKSVKQFVSDGAKRCGECQKRHRAWYLRTHGDTARRSGLVARSPHGESLQSDFTYDGWCRVQAAFRWECAYCGVPSDELEQDHVLAISKGGHDLLANIVPACEPCNSSKHAHDVNAWLAKRGKKVADAAIRRMSKAAGSLSAKPAA